MRYPKINTFVDAAADIFLVMSSLIVSDGWGNIENRHFLGSYNKTPETRAHKKQYFIGTDREAKAKQSSNVCSVLCFISFFIILGFIDTALQTLLAFSRVVTSLLFHSCSSKEIITGTRLSRVSVFPWNNLSHSRSIVVNRLKSLSTMHVVGVDVGGTNTGECSLICVFDFLTVPHRCRSLASPARST